MTHNPNLHIFTFFSLQFPSLHIYSAWLLGHNRIHHGFTVHQERDFVWHPYSVEEFKEFSTRKRLIHRLQWSCFGAGIYYLSEVWWKKMIALTAPAKLVKDINKDNQGKIKVQACLL